MILSLLVSCANGNTAVIGEVRVPYFMEAEGYPAHVHLRWNDNVGSEYEIYRMKQNGRFEKFGRVAGNEYMDFSIGKSDASREYIYRICPVGLPVDSAEKFQVKAEVPAATDSALLDMVQEYTLRYFTDFAHPHTGLARERSNDINGDIVTTGGTGFGLMALIAGAERGFITKDRAIEIIGKIVTFLEDCEKFHGAWAHWYDGDTRKAFSFSKYDNGGDIVETAFLVEGLLAVRQWLTGADSNEYQALAQRCDKLWKGVEWDWYTRGEDALYWHWSKDHGWKMNHKIRGFDETFITYVLGVSSPTHPISKEVYDQGWARNGGMKNGKKYYDITLPLGTSGDKGGPLFFAHYSFLGLDPRNLEDQYANYWEQNTAHAKINHAYCVANPKKHYGYSDECWGLTASDIPNGYTANLPGNDNGTIAPTAALASFPYTPEESMKAMRYFYYALGDKLFGEYGFHDAFNLSQRWFAPSYIAIDQGPIVVMIENYRTGLLWEYFMKNEDVKRGLDKLGFTY